MSIEVSQMSKVTITICHVVGDTSEEWVVSDDGGEFDDEVFSASEAEDNHTEAEAEARDDAAARAAHYQQQGRQWSQEET